METLTAPKPITEMSASEIKAYLAKKEEEDKAEYENAKKTYVSERDKVIEDLLDEANQLAIANAKFKQKCHIVLESQKEKLESYGGIRSNSKGGFSIIHSNTAMKVTRRRDTDPTWDERAAKAVDLIKDFIGDTVRKRDAKLHDILLKFLERNAKGDLEYSKVMELLQHEDKFDDSRWINGLQLIKESYSQGFKSFGYEFQSKDEAGKWQTLTLNFSSL